MPNNTRSERAYSVISSHLTQWLTIPYQTTPRYRIAQFPELGAVLRSAALASLRQVLTLLKLSLALLRLTAYLGFPVS